MDQAEEAAAMFAQISRALLAEPEEPVTLQRIADGAVEIIAACDSCGISLRDKRGSVTTPASTAPIADECDKLQYKLHEGPCLDAIWQDEAYVIDDTTRDSRWPKWAPEVAAKGVLSVLSVRLFLTTETFGSLNLYAGKPFAFRSDDVELALVYAMHAATALSAARLVTGLHEAIQTRHLIGVAQGIIVQRYGLSVEGSFEVLKRYSSHANIKLRDVAQLVVDTRSVPDDRSGDLNHPKPTRRERGATG